MVIDTNILIAYLDNDKKVIEALNYWFAHSLALFISAVTYAEVLALPEASEADLVRIRSFLANFILVDVNKELAELAANIKRRYTLKFPDSAVAATAKHLQVSLVTRDKQLGKVKEVTVINI